MKNIFKSIRGSSLVALVGLTLVMTGCQPSGPGTTSAKQGDQLLDTVVAAGKIRVGYVTYPPGVIKDANTGKLSGYFYDALNEAGKNLDLKVEWTEEVGWDTMIEGLNTGRYDIVGSPVWATSARGKVADFTIPLSYGVLGAYVATSNNRFNQGIKSLNSGNVKIATIDGEISDILARARFPQAKRVSLPQATDVSQALLNVTTGKADIAFVEPYIAAEYLKKNPGSIKNVAASEPLLYTGNRMMFRKGEPQFKAMMDTALQEILGKGFVDDLLKKYDPAGTIYRVAAPYRSPQ